MEKRKGKIGINTMFIIFQFSCFSPAVRLFGTYTAIAAGQAGWLSPIIACMVIFYLISKLEALLVDHPGLSLIEIYEKIIGRFLAKAIAIVYLIWTINLIGGNLKSYTMRLSTALYPNIKENLFLVITLIIIAVLIGKSGFVVAARMFKIFNWIGISGFFIIIGLILPNVAIDKLTPISYLDIMPIIKGSMVIIATWTYLTVYLVISDNVIGIKDFKKRGLQTIGFLTFTSILLIVAMMGTSGSYLLTKAAFPFLITVEQIVLLDAVTGVDAILVMLWIMSDFVMISLLLFSCLKLIKYIFNIKDASIFTNILMVFIFFFTNVAADNYYELRDFAYHYIYPTNIILFTVIPVLMAWFYKIKKKASKALKASRES